MLCKCRSISGYNKIRIKPTANSFVSNYILYKEASASVYYPLDTLDANTQPTLTQHQIQLFKLLGIK